MARNEQDREDLMREATAFFPRAEMQVEHETAPVFWGQKKNGHFSFYFGGEPVYQFDQDGLLRRAFIDGHLYRTQKKTLARLTRERNSAETVLKRYDLTIKEVESLLQTMADRFQKLHSAFVKNQNVRLIQSLSDNSDSELQALIQNQIKQVLQNSDQLAPRIRGKR